MRRAPLSLALLSCMLAACTAERPRAIVEAAPPPEPAGPAWRGVATVGDRVLVDALPGRWSRALAAVPRRVQAKMRAEGPLVDPAAALEKPALPPGPYHCRLLRFGGRAGFASFPPDFCYVEASGPEMFLVKQTGSNLPGGWLYEDTATRSVFLGVLRARADGPAPRYGADPLHDVAGVVERVSSFRWRLTLTKAARDGALDVYELVPVTPQVPGAKPAVPAESAQAQPRG